jgi:tetratricopeptide (TPR) repeat protein
MVGSGLPAQVRIWEDVITLPTYEPKPPDRNPMFYVPDAYQGAKRVIYPYPLMDNLSSEKADKEHRAVFLENEYIRLCLLPDIGGRLFYATDKTNNYEIFYRQHVIKPANIGMLGAWISGGIEWCVFHHHRASTHLPLDYRLVENDDGSKTIWFGEIEPRHRMKWSIGLTLHPGRSYIETDVRMYNRTEHTHSILYWANVATHVNEDYRVIFPPSVHQGVYHAKNSFIHWPVSDEIYNGKDYRGGIDVSLWKNHPEPVSIFAHDLQEDFMGGYDYSKDAGTVHVGNHHIVKGAKLWEWGPGDFGRMWDSEILTDSDGPYAEIMVGGYSDNQPDYSWIKPGETKFVKHYWYPVREIGGFKNANPEAVVNLELDNTGTVTLGFNTTHWFENCRVILLQDEVQIFEDTVTIDPATPYFRAVKTRDTTRISGLEVLLLDRFNNELISYREKERVYEPDLPETVRPPALPADIENLEEVVLTGQRIMQFHNHSYQPEDYFNEALARDPGHSLANLHMGNLAAKAGKYNDAAGYYRKSIERLTRDYTRPRDCEAFYRLGVVLRKQKKYENAIDTLYRATWDQAYYASAHAELAGISLVRGNISEAVQHLDRVLAVNSLNPKIHGLKAAALRRLGKHYLALEHANKALEIDPLDHLATFELLQLEAVSETDFTKLLNNNRENYLELVTDYITAGLLDEAMAVINLALGTEHRELSTEHRELSTENRALGTEHRELHAYPILHYYYAYLNLRKGDVMEAGSYFRSATALPTDHVFPFRFETLEVLDAAIRYDPEDARAWYYLGNILYDHQPGRAIQCWEEAVRLDHGLFIAYRNLGWGYNRHYRDLEMAISFYEKAIEVNPHEARYFYELDVLYENGNAELERRYEMLTPNHGTVVIRDDALLREIEVLILNREYDSAIRYLDEYTFQRQEGVVNLHDLFVDVHLLKGRELLLEALFDQALEHFLRADTYPENHMIGRIPDYSKEAKIFYLTGLAYQGMNDNESAEAFFSKAASVPVGNSEYLFDQALTFKKLGEKGKTDELSMRLLEIGQSALEDAGRADFFAKFGEGETLSERKALAHYFMALGYLGSGQKGKAEEALSRALELKNSLLWAGIYMDQLKGD